MIRTAAALHLLLACTGLAGANRGPYACTGQRAVVGGVTYKTEIKLVTPPAILPLPAPATHLTDPRLSLALNLPQVQDGIPNSPYVSANNTRVQLAVKSAGWLERLGGTVAFPFEFK
jgi:hypothetical protein